MEGQHTFQMLSKKLNSQQFLGGREGTASRLLTSKKNSELQGTGSNLTIFKCPNCSQ